MWADHYDETVQLSDENHLYPFAGYKEILNLIFNEVMQKEHSHVLDIGFGTCVLTRKLYNHGPHIEGIVISSKMIHVAYTVMPNAYLIELDISKGLALIMKSEIYDTI